MMGFVIGLVYTRYYFEQVIALLQNIKNIIILDLIGWKLIIANLLLIDMTSQFENSSLIQKWVTDKLDIQSVEQNLQSLGYDEQSINILIREFKKTKAAKRQINGFVYLGIGAFLGFLSCVLTLINPFPELFNWILFGLTSIAILMLSLGLFNVFE